MGRQTKMSRSKAYLLNSSKRLEIPDGHNCERVGFSKAKVITAEILVKAYPAGFCALDILDDKVKTTSIRTFMNMESSGDR